MKTKIITFALFYLCTVVASSSSLVWDVGTGWYSEIIRPSFAPPNWVFGPVWTILYILIAISAYRIMYAAKNEYKSPAMAFWSLQMCLNTIWTPIFFGANNLEVAFYYIIALWASIVGTIITAWKVDRTSSVILMPYLVWVSFASVLNYAFWQLNI